MIRQILRLTRWEWFKLRRRWMPWILLAVLVAIPQLRLWGTYAVFLFVPLDMYVVVSIPADADGVESSIRVSCDDIEGGKVDSLLADVPDEFREQALREVESLRERCPGIRDEDAARSRHIANNLILPGSLTSGLNAVAFILPILVMILASSAIGAEYGLGTFRPALTRGARRWEFLGAKVLSIALTLAAGLLVVSLSVVAGSMAATLLIGEDVVAADSGQWSSAALAFGKLILALLPYIAVATFFTVLTASGMAGVSISLVHFLFELTVFSPLADLLGLNIGNFLLAPNVTMVWASTFPLPAGEGAGALASFLDMYLNPFLVMLAYTVVSGTAAFWLFLHRDVTGPRGE